MKVETKKKLKKIAKILKIIFAILIIISFLIPVKKKGVIDKKEAVNLCRSYYGDLYKQRTGLKTKIGMFSSYEKTENKNTTWVLTVWGECQNVFGTWMQIPARCVVNKKPVGKSKFDYANIIEFEFKIK